jgi:hypothetical protein
MGVYRRKDGRCKNRTWWISLKDGRQHRESSGSTNKKSAEKLLTLRSAQVFEERWSLPRSKSPRLGIWSEEFLKSQSHDKTRSRYRSSINNILRYFGKDIRISEIRVESVNPSSDFSRKG